MSKNHVNVQAVSVYLTDSSHNLKEAFTFRNIDTQHRILKDPIIEKDTAANPGFRHNTCPFLLRGNTTLY
jgi:hypothetical protein